MTRAGRNIVSLAFFLLACCANLPAQHMTLELDSASTKIEFTLSATLHTVHGTFALKSGAVRFDPTTGSASGRVVIDVASGQTGNQGRDHKMHKDVLQSDKYPEATFNLNKISGSFAPQGSSTVQLEGIFRIHGDDHPITLSIPVEVIGTTLTAKSQLQVPYVAWGMKNPSTLLLHVSDKVDVDISATGHLIHGMQTAVAH